MTRRRHLTPGTTSASLPARAFRAFLRLYHPDFRREYGTELEGAFQSAYERRARSSLAAAGLLSAALLSCLVHGTATRCRAMRRRSAGTLADLRLAMRGLRRSPGFALIVVSVLGMAIAVGTTAFSLVYASLWHPLPYADPDALVWIWGSNRERGQLRDVIAGSTFTDFRAQATQLEGLAAFESSEIVLLEDGRARLAGGLAVTPGFFETLGIDAAVGRTFLPADGLSGSEPTLVLTHDAWQTELNGDPDVVGRRLQTTGGDVTIIGVLPEGFRFAVPAALFIPLATDVIATDEHTHFHYWALGRLRSGATIESATAELAAAMARIAVEDPRLADWSVIVEPVAQLLRGPVRPVVTAIAVAICLVWAIAVANIAGLMAIRATTRRPEMHVRAALGATRWQLARGAWGEALLLAATGGLAGLIVARALVEALPALLPESVAIAGAAASFAGFQWQFDARVAAAGIVASLASGLLCGMPAALLAAASGSGPGARQCSASGSPRRRSGRDVLVVAELALATLLAVGAGLAIATTRNLLAVDSGLRPEGVVTMYVGALDEASVEERVRFFGELLVRVEQIPGVTAAGLNDYVPLRREDDFEGFLIEGRPRPASGNAYREEWRRVSRDYFTAAGIDLLAGRGFSDDDFESGPSVTILNEALVRRYFPGEEAVGEHLRIGGGIGLTEIVGVARDVRERGLNEEPPPMIYVPFTRNTRPVMALFVRAQGPAAGIVNAVRETVASIDPRQPVDGVAPLAQVVHDSVAVQRLLMNVAGALAATALGLAALGVFGTISYSVRQRRREIGIRRAVGAPAGRLAGDVITRALVLAVAGVVTGLLTLLLASGPLEALLFGVTVTDATLLIGVAFLLLTTTVAAALLPACTAARVDPAVVIRTE